MCPEEVIVSESQPPNKLLTVVRAFDNDNLPGVSSPNGIVSYSTSSSIVAVSSTGQVFLNQKLDRERVSSYAIAIEAFDGGSPAKFARCTFNLLVGDENDNAPVFDDATEFVKVIPNTLGKNEIVYDFTVVDADSGKNALFFLELEDDFDLFYINSENELRMARNFTASDPSRVNLKVRATDSGGLASEIAFAVEILPPEALMRSSTQELAIASICGLFSVILVLCLVIFCLKRNRKQQTYKFRNAEDKEEINASKQTLSNWTVEIKNDAALVKTGLIVEPSEDGSVLYKTRSHDHGSDFIPDSGKFIIEKLKFFLIFDNLKNLFSIFEILNLISRSWRIRKRLYFFNNGSKLLKRLFNNRPQRHMLDAEFAQRRNNLLELVGSRLLARASFQALGAVYFKSKSTCKSDADLRSGKSPLFGLSQLSRRQNCSLLLITVDCYLSVNKNYLKNIYL